MTTQQPEALRLANILRGIDARSLFANEKLSAASAALENQQARITDLESQLEAIGAGGVSGPLIGQPQAMPDLSALILRGAVAWAGVDAQGLRDGGASPSANAGEPSGHIKEPYTLAEIKAKIASNDYSAEMLLQHAMLLLDSASLSASAQGFRDGAASVSPGSKTLASYAIRLLVAAALITQAKADEALRLAEELTAAPSPADGESNELC